LMLTTLITLFIIDGYWWCWFSPSESQSLRHCFQFHWCSWWLPLFDYAIARFSPPATFH
jgi:hypothetical protein